MTGSYEFHENLMAAVMEEKLRYVTIREGVVVNVD